MRIILMVLSIMTFVGCQGVDRLINGRESDEGDVVEVIIGGESLGEAPNFNVPIPDGTERVVYHGLTPVDGKVTVIDVIAPIHVFIKVRGGVNQWFVVGSTVSGAYWFERDGQSIQYHGNLGNTEFCVYQYVPQEGN